MSEICPNLHTKTLDAQLIDQHCSLLGYARLLPHALSTPASIRTPTVRWRRRRGGGGGACSLQEAITAVRSPTLCQRKVSGPRGGAGRRGGALIGESGHRPRGISSSQVNRMSPGEDILRTQDASARPHNTMPKPIPSPHTCTTSNFQPRQFLTKTHRKLTRPFALLYESSHYFPCEEYNFNVRHREGKGKEMEGNGRK